MTKQEALIRRSPQPSHSTSQVFTLANLLDYQQCGATEYGEQRKISPDSHNAMFKLTDRLLHGINHGRHSISDAVAGYIEEFRKLLAVFNHRLTCADEVTFQVEVEIAKDAGEGKLTREEALSKLRTITTRHLNNLYYGRS